MSDETHCISERYGESTHFFTAENVSPMKRCQTLYALTACNRKQTSKHHISIEQKAILCYRGRRAPHASLLAPLLPSSSIARTGLRSMIMHGDGHLLPNQPFFLAARVLPSPGLPTAPSMSSSRQPTSETGWNLSVLSRNPSPRTHAPLHQNATPFLRGIARSRLASLETHCASP